MTEITKYRAGDVGELMQLGKVFAHSGFFADARQEAQAVVKILAGAEMGFSPIASMMGVYVINGRVSVGANLMAAAVKKSGKYDYKVLKNDDTVCEIEYFQGGQSIGKSAFTIQDARKAGTKNLDKFPRNMLFARAMSNGVRWYCPDVLGGTPVYTPEEMGADTDEEGNVKVLQGVVVEEAEQAAEAVETTDLKPSTYDRMEALAIRRYNGQWNSKKAGFAAYTSSNRTSDPMLLTEAEALAAIKGLEEALAPQPATA